MGSVFQFLGMILDDIPEKSKFLFDWQEDTLMIECNNCYIINDFILPLCEGKIEEQYQLLENCKWFFAVIRFSQNPQYQIKEIEFVTDSGESLICDVGAQILGTIYTFDNVYFSICQAIAKQCSFIVDKVRIV